ncbi:MAG: hypothetical protein U1B83_07285, partial [Candidatus Cloacimonadaceae bacterium]|nr:hypothetical protein [Candidatus Cloacimonadaceae bacterium]
LRQAPDPDSLYYQAILEQGGEQQSFVINPAVEDSQFRVSMLVAGSGTIRVRAVDGSGNVSDYAVYAFESSVEGFAMSISPNPVLNRFSATLRWLNPSINGNIRLNIYNIRGQKVIDADLGTAQIGQGIQPLILVPGFAKLSSGRYLLELIIGAAKQSRGFTIM